MLKVGIQLVSNLKSEGAESENDGYQAEFLVFNLLIAIFG